MLWCFMSDFGSILDMHINFQVSNTKRNSNFSFSLDHDSFSFIHSCLLKPILIDFHIIFHFTIAKSWAQVGGAKKNKKKQQELRRKSVFNLYLFEFLYLTASRITQHSIQHRGNIFIYICDSHIKIPHWTCWLFCFHKMLNFILIVN